MRKTVLASFITIVVLGNLILFLLTKQAAAILPSESISDDIDSCLYALQATPEQQKGYSFPLYSDSHREVALILSNAEDTVVLLNDTVIFKNTPQSPYSRVHIIPFVLSGKAMLTIRAHSWNLSSKEILTQTPSTRINAYLGGAQAAENMQSVFLAANALCIGMYFFMALNSLILYSCKKSETYLLHLAFVSAATMLIGAVNSNICFIPISNQTYSVLRPIVVLLPVIMNISLFFSLLSSHVPMWFRPFCNRWMLLVSTILLIGADMIFRLNLHYLLVFLMLPPVLQTIAGAMQKQEKDAVILLIGYAAGISVIIEVMCYHAGFLYTTNIFNTYMALVQLNYFLNLLCCSAFIGRRFARKFCDAEKLTVQLGEMNAHLEEKVAERTQSLRDEQERKHNMMINIFHDLRSPVFVLEGRLNELSPQSKEETEAVQVMKSRLAYLHRLIEDLFLTAKLESGKLVFDERDVDLTQTLEHVVQAQQTLASGKNVTLSFEKIPDVMVWGDPQRLEQVFQNLLENALHHAPEGTSIKLTMRTQKHGICVDVTDCGNGIKPEDLPRIFERYFYRKSKGNPSSGLGLSIAKEIVAAHQGTLSASSEAGKGSTFTVYLPLCQE